MIFGSVISGLAMGGIMGLIELITNTGGILRRSDDFVPISSFPRRYPIRLCYILGLILSFIIEYHVSDFCQRFARKIFHLISIFHTRTHSCRG